MQLVGTCTAIGTGSKLPVFCVLHIYA